MALDDGDYLKWYNDEIIRYRNYEWQLSGYSISISSAILLFANRSETKGLLGGHFLTIVVSIFVLALLASECHVHRRLNHFRELRTLLRKGDAQHMDHDHVEACLISSWTDCLYFIGFILLPLGFGVGAFLVLWNGPPA